MTKIKFVIYILSDVFRDRHRSSKQTHLLYNSYIDVISGESTVRQQRCHVQPIIMLCNLCQHLCQQVLSNRQTTAKHPTCTAETYDSTHYHLYR